MAGKRRNHFHCRWRRENIMLFTFYSCHLECILLVPDGAWKLVLNNSTGRFEFSWTVQVPLYKRIPPFFFPALEASSSSIWWTTFFRPPYVYTSNPHSESAVAYLSCDLYHWLVRMNSRSTWRWFRCAFNDGARDLQRMISIIAQESKAMPGRSSRFVLRQISRHRGSWLFFMSSTTTGQFLSQRYWT